MFYNPYTKQSGKYGVVKGKRDLNLNIPGHDNHLHVASDNSDEMKKIMEKAHSMGLTVHENPYATKQGWDPDGVQNVHTGKWHYITYADGTGGATDITGPQDKINDFIDNYLYKEVFPNPESSESGKSDSKISNSPEYDTSGPTSDSSGSKPTDPTGKSSVSSSNSEWSPENVLYKVKNAFTSMAKEGKVENGDLISEEIQRIKNLMK